MTTAEAKEIHQWTRDNHSWLSIWLPPKISRRAADEECFRYMLEIKNSKTEWDAIESSADIRRDIEDDIEHRIIFALVFGKQHKVVGQFACCYISGFLEKYAVDRPLKTRLKSPLPCGKPNGEISPIRRVSSGLLSGEFRA